MQQEQSIPVTGKSYQRLNRSQMILVAHQILHEAGMHALREFLDDYYGEATYQVTIQSAQEKYGPRVEHIRVYSTDGKPVPPDFDLPAWQELRENDDDAEALATTNDGIDTLCSDVGDVLVQLNVFLDYGIPPEEEHDLLIEQGLEPKYPDLYQAL